MSRESSPETATHSPVFGRLCWRADTPFLCGSAHRLTVEAVISATTEAALLRTDSATLWGLATQNTTPVAARAATTRTTTTARPAAAAALAKLSAAAEVEVEVGPLGGKRCVVCIAVRQPPPPPHHTTHTH